ncbi:protein of unknown function (plasmid) [Pararobbsia alpina]
MYVSGAGRYSSDGDVRMSDENLRADGRAASGSGTIRFCLPAGPAPHQQRLPTQDGHSDSHVVSKPSVEAFDS